MKKIFLFLSLSVFTAQTVFAGTVFESTAKDRKSIEISVYNDNFAMVREVRQAALPQGASAVQYLDVPSFITPETIQVRSLTAPEDLNVFEQDYEQNTLDSNSLLQKFVGKKIKLMTWNEFQDRKETVEAVLLSNAGEPIYQIGQEVYIGHPGSKILPEIPAGMLIKPAFVWQVENKNVKPHELEVSYLTSGLSWKMDYVLTIPETGNTGQMSAWATLNNQSGTDFENAGLRLLAGQVNRAPRYNPAPRMYAMKAEMAAMSDAGGSFQQKPAFEYHSYDLSRKVSLAQNETKQVQFSKTKAVKFSRELRVEGSPNYYASITNQDKQKVPVRVFIKLTNSTENGLGTPLPQGTVRMYSSDAKGQQTFVGEDGISHTAKKEEIKLRAGESFDVVAERKQTDFRQVTSNVTESEYEIKLKNRKNEDVEVVVVETIPGNWETISQSQQFEKINASTIQTKVKVLKNSEVTVKYRVKVGF